MTDSNKLHFGIKTTQYFSYEDILRVWQEAETLPSIEHTWLFDHPMPIGSADPGGPCLNGWTLLAALDSQTPAAIVPKYPYLKLLDTVQAPHARITTITSRSP